MSASTYLLAFTALFSIVNPLTGAFTFYGATHDFSPRARAQVSRRVAFYSFCLITASLYVGAYILSFLGVSLPSLQVAGGIVIALSGWGMLTSPDSAEQRRSEASSALSDHAVSERLSFYPLTMPLTVGPGTISVAISLGANRPTGVSADAIRFFISTELAVATLAICIYLTYRHSDHLADVIGKTGTAIVVRLSAFLLFCIGIQIGWSGLYQLLSTLPFATPQTLP
ncbi:MAG: MarC family protein [Pseudomonadota bacterium]